MSAGDLSDALMVTIWAYLLHRCDATVNSPSSPQLHQHRNARKSIPKQYLCTAMLNDRGHGLHATPSAALTIHGTIQLAGINFEDI